MPLQLLPLDIISFVQSLKLFKIYVNMWYQRLTFVVSVSDSFEFRIGVRSGSALPLLLDGDSRPAILTPTDIGMGRSLSLIFSC